MNNPWKNLPHKEPYVLDVDKEIIERYNERGNPKIFLNHPPDPYLGNPSANLFLLNGNPGHSQAEVDYCRQNNQFMEANRKNLLHESLEYPFYVLDPRFEDWQGYIWWNKKLRSLIAEFNSVKDLSKKIFCAELAAGYHSISIPYGLSKKLKSQEYTCQIIGCAIERGAKIIIMRAESEWLELIPFLKKNYYTLRNYRNVTISRGNLKEGVFDQILMELRKK